MQQALTVVGQQYRNFIVTKYLPLSELQSTLIEMVHENSGARIIHIANDDPENLFALSFQTLPSSSNGVAHVLEHLVLCGSEKFPIKDPFFSMTRRSLNTYMNALTGQDFTVYPASSQIEKDLYNLLEVYLDAVFHPLLKPLSFMQEGHRLSFKNKGDITSPLQFEGVVYNEMKGAMNSSDERLSHALFRYLTPDLPYAFNSGGDPKEIPSLTYDELKEFHRTFYHPSRCLFFFYGNISLVKHIDFIETRALNHVEKVPLLAPFKAQKRFNSPWRATEKYGIGPDESPKKKTIVACGFLTAPISNQTELLALSLIDSLLTDTDVSPLKLALLESKLCTSVESTLDTEMSEAPWILICKGCAKNSEKKIVDLLRSCLEKLTKKGFDQSAIDASLHQLEFERTEIGADNVPFGLSLFFRSILPKQHGAEPEQALLIHSLFEDLKNRIADPTYLTELLRHYFLDNPHAVYLTMQPDSTLEENERNEELTRLNAIQKKLSKSDLLALAEQEKQFCAYQEQIEHQSLECLPKLTLQDVPPHAKDYPLTTSTYGPLALYHHNCFTNRIIYADLIFDLPQIKCEDLPLLSLFSRFLTEVGSGGRTYAQTLELQHASLGDFVSTLLLNVQHDDPAICRPMLSLKAKALARNTLPMLGLLKDTAASLNFRDFSRIKQLLAEQATELQNRLPKDALGYAVQLASCGLSAPSAINQQLTGLSYLSYLLKLAHFPRAQICDQLDHFQHTALGSIHPSLVLSCAPDEEKLIRPHLLSFAAELPSNNQRPWSNEFSLPKIASQGRIISSPVAFTALAFKSVSYRDVDSAALMVATDLMENVVLHKEIREKGGAYGSGATYAPGTGQFYFYSYRDPHLATTYRSFEEAVARISAKQFSERELLEAKLGILQDLDAPLPPRQRGFSAFVSMSTGRTYERRDQFRRAILNVPAEAVAAAVEKHLGAQFNKGVLVSFAGEELLRQEAKQLPFPFEILQVLGEMN